MGPLETLRHEHGLIRQVLDLITLADEKLVKGKKPPAEFFQKTVDFIRLVVFQLHHFKEEHILFGLLAQKKNGEIDGKVEALRHQHERGREIISNIEKSLQGYQEGKSLSLEQLQENLSGYASLLRDHMHQEDYILYPMAAKELTEQEIEALEKEFDREATKHGEHPMEKNRELVMEIGALLLCS